MSSLAGLSAIRGWPLCDVWMYGTPMGGYPNFGIVLGLYYVSCDSVRSWYPGMMLRIQLECAVSLTWLFEPTECWEDGPQPWRAGIWKDTARMLLNICIPKPLGGEWISSL